MVGLLFALTIIVAPSASGQLLSAAPGIQVSIGPQVSTLGLGAGASARFARMFGASVEYNYALGVPGYEKHGFDNTLMLDNRVQGGMIMAMFHPTGGSFAIGLGLLFGGATSEGELNLDPSDGTTIDLGDRTYSVAQVGKLTGDVDYSGVAPVFAIGMMGSGLNLALGAALGKPTLDVSASGPLSSNTTFQSDLDMEVDEITDVLDKVPVYPYLRIGWRFRI